MSEIVCVTTGKIRYDTRSEASHHKFRTMHRRGGKPKNKLSIYWCNDCQGWHLGRKTLGRKT